MHTNETADAIRVLIQEVRNNLDRIETYLRPSEEVGLDDLDPKSPLNKTGVNLTPRGVEVAYRMFDAGKTRYAVAQALGISFGAATNRQHAWEKAGGNNRQKRPLTVLESYESKYGPSGADVLSSKNAVAGAARSGDLTKVEEARERHHELMKSLLKSPGTEDDRSND